MTPLHENLPRRGEDGPDAKGPGQVGTRTCVGCRQEAGKQGLIRLVRRPEGGAAVDRTGRASGRGAYLHNDPSCLEMARKKRSVDRALHTTVQPELWSELAK